MTTSIQSAIVNRLQTNTTGYYAIPSPLAPCYHSAGRSCLGLSGLQASCRLGSHNPLLLVRCRHRVGGHAGARLTTFTITVLSTASEVRVLAVYSAARPHARRPKPGAQADRIPQPPPSLVGSIERRGRHSSLMRQVEG